MKSLYDEEVEAQHEQSMQLSQVLTRVGELQAEKDRIAAEASTVNKALREIEQMAVELLAASGLDGVRAGGKSWYVREFFSVSVPSQNRDAVVEAAEAAGLSDLIAVNTTTLKSWLIEQRTANADSNLAAGTPFDGLISEFREMRLSHRTLG